MLCRKEHEKENKLRESQRNEKEKKGKCQKELNKKMKLKPFKECILLLGGTKL
jgi:hypothetical protein